MGWIDRLAAALAGVDTSQAFVPAPIVVVSEATADDVDYTDPDANLASANPGNAAYWRSLGSGYSDLGPHTHERMQSIAQRLYDRNGVAKAMVDTIVDHIVGEGMSPTVSIDQGLIESLGQERAESVRESTHAVLRKHWDDPINDWDERAGAIARELSIFGEQCLMLFVHRGSGSVRVVPVSPRAITGVLRDPVNLGRVLGVKLGRTGANTDVVLKVLHPGNNGVYDVAVPGEMIGAGADALAVTTDVGQPPDTLLAGCFFLAINKTTIAARGRSDQFSIADHLDAYEDMVFSEIERAKLLKSHIWDVRVDGASQKMIDEMSRLPLPKPGSVRFHNESMEWNAVSPSIGSADTQNIADLSLSFIASSSRIPKHWLNGIMDVNRATASEMNGPAIKGLTARQRVVTRFIRKCCRFAIEQAVAAGVLDRVALECTIRIDAPDMSPTDQASSAETLNRTVSAIGLARAAKLIDAETAARVIASVLSGFGVDVDPQEMLSRLEEEELTDGDDIQPLPSYLGQGKAPGPDAITQPEKRNGAAVRSRR